jgi:hypothetical protein
MKKYFLIFVLLVSFSSGFIVSNVIKSKENTSQIILNPLTQAVKGTSTSMQCTEDLRLGDATKKLDNNQEAINILKKNCMWLFGSLNGDLEGTGKNDLVFWGSGAGCGSCHGQSIYVVSGNKVIFNQIEDDPQISIKKLETGRQGLVISRPLFQHGDTYGSHTWGLTTTYVWFENIFVQEDERPYKY